MKIRNAIGALTLILLSVLSGMVRAEAAPPVEILKNASVPESYLTRDYLRALFTLRTRVWPDGQPVTLYVFHDGSPLHASFCREELGTYPYILRSVWDRVLFSGTGVIPYAVDSEEEMVRQVLSTPGALGYRTRRDDPVKLVEPGGMQ